MRIGRAAAREHQISCVGRMLETEIVPKLVAYQHPQVIRMKTPIPVGIDKTRFAGYDATVAAGMRGWCRNAAIDPFDTASDVERLDDKRIDIVVGIRPRPIAQQI